MSSSDDVKRERAFELYYQSGGAGKKRSIEALWRGWVEAVRDNPDARQDIPTLNRETVYKWAKSDDWVEKASNRDHGETQLMKETYAKARERGYDAMSMMIPKVVESLYEASQDAPWRERIAAANSLLDRVGLISQSKVKNPLGETNSTSRKAPAFDADEETLAAWLAETQGSQRNG